MASFALINDENIVENIIVLDISNAHEFPNAVEYIDKAVGIGDEYRDGDFYRNGELIPTYFEDIAMEVEAGLIAQANLAYTEGVNSI